MHRENLVFADGVVQRRNQVFFAESFPSRRILPSARRRPRRPVPPASRAPPAPASFMSAGISRLFALAVAAQFVGVGLHADQVDHAASGSSRCRSAARAESRRAQTRLVSDSSTRSASARSRSMRLATISARRLVFFAIIPHPLGDDFHAGHAIDHNDRRIDHRQHHLGFVDEHVEAGRVEDIDLGLAPLHVGQRRLKSTSCGRFLLRRNRWWRCRRPRGPAAGSRRPCTAWRKPARSCPRARARPPRHSGCLRLHRLSRWAPSAGVGRKRPMKRIRTGQANPTSPAKTMDATTWEAAVSTGVGRPCQSSLEMPPCLTH